MEEPVLNEETVQIEQLTAVKGKKKTIWIAWGCIAVFALAAVVFFLTARPRKYARAVELYEAQNYEAAAQQFSELENYRDAQTQTQSAYYEWALVLMDQKQYTQALDVFGKLGDYKACTDRMQQCHFALGQEAMEAAEYDIAAGHFAQAQTSGAAPQRLKQALYERGHELYMQEQYQQAQEYFDQLEGDWPSGGGPHFQELDEALDYLQTQAEQMPTGLTVVVKNVPGFYMLNEEMLNVAIQQHMGYQFADVTYNQDNNAVTVIPSYYPGQRIIRAWKNSDTSQLDEEELRTYEKALALVEEAKAQVTSEDPVEIELWLHDWICDNVVYDSPYMYVPPEDFVELRELTCVGALLDGIANCQGYTDAFYLLGTMAGLDVCKVFGTADGEGHCWNAVRLNERLYTVDVTFDDSFGDEPGKQAYVWFNNALDMDQYTVYGGVSQFGRMVFLEDLSQTYYTRNEMVYEEFADAVYMLLREYRKNGPGVCHAVVEGLDWDADDFYTTVANNMALAKVYNAQWNVVIVPYKGDSYIYVEWM